jgi:hypothetical protein
VTILSWGFWDEPRLWWSNVYFKFCGTFLCLASKVISCHFFCPLLEGPHLTIHAGNKCDSKYTMKSATRVQVLEFWHVMCGSFCTRKRKKEAMWLQEEEYSEWLTGCIGTTSATKVSTNLRSLQRSQQKGFVVRFCSEWTKDALTTQLCFGSYTYSYIAFFILDLLIPTLSNRVHSNPKSIF